MVREQFTTEGVVHTGKTQEPAALRSTRPGPLDCAGDRPPPASAQDLVFFVLVGLIQGQAAELVGDFEQVLVAFVPLRADFAEEHRPLVGPTQLQKSYAADMSTEPASVFHIVAVGDLRVRQ